MDRREFLITTSGAAVAASAAATASAAESELATPSIVGSRRTLELATTWPDDGKGFGDSARRLARSIEALTDGRYRIEIRDGSAQNEAAGLAHGTAHDYAAQHPAFAYFAGLPGAHGLSAQDFAAWLTVGGGQMLWDDLAAGAGVKPLLAGHSGSPPPLWSAIPVASLSDLAGRKIYAPGLGADVARALGAEPVTISVRDVVPALADRSIDIAEWGGLLTSMAAGIPAHARYATGSGFNTKGTALALHVSMKVWNDLPQADKAAFEAAAMQEFHASCAEARAHDAIARKTLASRFGVEFSPFSPDIAEAMKRVADATVAHVAGRDANANRIDASYMAFKATIAETQGALV